MRALLVVFDTLRYDHASCYGYVRYTTPNLDRLALEGTLFTNAYATDTPAQASYTALFTGKRGIQTGVVGHDQWEDKSVRQTPTFPEVLSRNGILTAAVSTLPRFRSRFTKGFKEYMQPGVEGKPQHVTAEMVNERAIPWLRAKAKEDFFLFLHYWDPHTPYNLAPESYVSRFYRGDPYDPENRSLEALRASPLMHYHLGSGPVPELERGLTDFEYLVAQYDAEIAHADEQLAEVLEVLEDQGVLEDTLVIFTSDHGEALGEHGVYFDHMNAYEEVAHVPLLLWHPQRVMPRNVSALAELTDVAPTVLEAFGMNVPEGFEGKSLWPLLGRKQDELHETVFTNHGMWSAQRAMRTKDWTLVSTVECGVLGPRPRFELFDRTSDPCETRDMAANSPEVLGWMKARYQEWLDGQLKGRPDPLESVACSGRQAWDWLKKRQERREPMVVQKGYPLPITAPPGVDDQPAGRADTTMSDGS